MPNGGTIAVEAKEHIVHSENDLQAIQEVAQARLAAIIPPSRQNQVRFHGVFAPHSQHHAAIKKL